MSFHGLVWLVWLGAGCLAQLLRWWNTIISEGKKNQLLCKRVKILADIKRNYLENAKLLFSNTAIKNYHKQKSHLGTSLGTKTFKNEYVQEKVEVCRKLAYFAKTKPHASFSDYIHGRQHRFTYFRRTIEGI